MSDKNVVTVNFRTNYNHKLDCPFFLHVDVAPAQGSVTESKIENTIIVINTIDGSHAPVKVKLKDLCRLPLKDLSENFIMLSHGISKNEFIKMLIQKPGVSDDTEIAYYFYKREEYPN